MKKITFFICTLSSGGAEHQMSILANFLSDKGYRIEIVTFGDEDDHYQLRPNIVRTRLAEKKPSWRKALAIFFFFLTVKTDCIISFSQRANALMLPAMFFRPKVTVIAGERNFTVGPSDGIERVLFCLLYKRANWIVPNSYSQGDYITQKRPKLKNRIKVITNYTDLEEYQFKPLKSSGKLKIGVFCRYAPQKNYSRFLRVIAKLKTEGYQDYEVHWYGNIQKLGNSNPDFVAFNTFVEEYELESIVITHNSTKNVPNILPLYDVLCLPSLFEGFSNSLSEYICCGRPVLASDVSDNHLMVHNGENGFLFNPEDEESIADAIRKILALTNEERELMGATSRRIAESLFNKETFIEAYTRLIED